MQNDVRALREAAGLSQGALGVALGVSRQTIQSIEVGKYDPSLPLAIRIARYFGQNVKGSSMSREHPSPVRTYSGFAAGLAVVVALFFVLRTASDSVALGALVGGLSVMALLAVAIWRARRGTATAALTRSAAGVADERDADVMRRSLAVGGSTSLIWLPGSLVAIVLGADPMISVTVALYGQLATLVIAYLVVERSR